MEFKLHTYDIQRLIISLICSDSENMSEDDRQRLLGKLTELNAMCKIKNDFTLNITVSG